MQLHSLFDCHIINLWSFSTPLLEAESWHIDKIAPWWWLVMGSNLEITSLHVQGKAMYNGPPPYLCKARSLWHWITSVLVFFSDPLLRHPYLFDSYIRNLLSSTCYSKLRHMLAILLYLIATSASCDHFHSWLIVLLSSTSIIQLCNSMLRNSSFYILMNFKLLFFYWCNH